MELLLRIAILRLTMQRLSSWSTSWPTHDWSRSDSHRHDGGCMDAGVRMDQRAVAFVQIGYWQDSARYCVRQRRGVS